MPHLVLEYSSGALTDPQICLKALVERFVQLPTVQPEAVKARAYLSDENCFGLENCSGFAHLEIRVLAGRSEELRSNFSADLYGRLLEFATSGTLVTVEVREMDSATYQKGAKP